MPSTQPLDIVFCGPAQSGKTKLFMKFLDNRPVESGPLFTPNHFETYFENYPITSWDVSDENYPKSNNAIWLYCVDLSKALDESTLIEAIHEIKKRNPFKVLLVGTKNDTSPANKYLEDLKDVCKKYKLDDVSTSTTQEKGYEALIAHIKLSIHQFSAFSSENLVIFRTNLEQVPAPFQQIFIPSVQADQRPVANNETNSEPNDVPFQPPVMSQEAQGEEAVASRNENNLGHNDAPFQPPVMPPETPFSPAAQGPSFDEAANSLEKSLDSFPAKSKKIMNEVAKLKKVIDDKKTPLSKKGEALQAFHNKSLAILKHQHHPALKALLAFTTFVFCAVVVAAIGFSIMGLVTGIWAPALLFAALTAAQPATIAVVSGASAAALTAGACTTYGLFKAPKPIKEQIAALKRFANTVQAKLDSESPST